MPPKKLRTYAPAGFLFVWEAAEKSGKSIRTIQNMLKTKRLLGRKLGREWIVNVSSLYENFNK